MRELLIFESIKENSKIQYSNITKMAPRTWAKNTRHPYFSRFAKAIISHEILNDFARCKHQTSSILTHEHNHTN